MEDEVTVRDLAVRMYELERHFKESWETSLRHEREDIKRFEMISEQLGRIEKELKDMKKLMIQE